MIFKYDGKFCIRLDTYFLEGDTEEEVLVKYIGACSCMINNYSDKQKYALRKLDDIRNR